MVSGGCVHLHAAAGAPPATHQVSNEAVCVCVCISMLQRVHAFTPLRLLNK